MGRGDWLVQWAAALGLLAAMMALMMLAGCGPARMYPGTGVGTGTDTQSVGTGTGTGMDPASEAAASVVENRLVVVYANGVVPEDAASRAAAAGGTLQETMPAVGMVVVECAPRSSAAVMAALEGDATVSTVMHDRVVQAHRLRLVPVTAMLNAKSTAPPNSGNNGNTGSGNTGTTNSSGNGDYYYTQTPQGWAVAQVGGYGGGMVSGSGAPAHGAWDVTMGAGVRIAVLDSGVDEAHPDIAPNLAVNLSEVNTAELPSACDDGTPWDQSGHGTWVASLAAAGPETGEVVGVAPQATILNIKVMERIGSGNGSATASCEAGDAGGLLSWVIAGIDDAMAQHAQVIVMSLGTLVDLESGDGAGWQATFDSVTYKAFAGGAVLVAAAGNDGFDLSNGRYIELPAQARDVLPVVATTNAACAENLSPGAVCAAGPGTLAYYSDYGAATGTFALGAVAAPGGSDPAGTDTGVSGFVRGACSNGEPETAEGLPSAGGSFGCFGLGHVQYVQAIGTSASAPLAGGEAALIFAAHPTWSAAQVVQQMETTATPGAQWNYGEVNAAAALQ